MSTTITTLTNVTTLDTSLSSTTVDSPAHVTTVQTNDPAVTIVDVGRTGPQGVKGDTGVQGAIGPSGGATVARIANTVLSGHRALKSVDSTRVAYCDAATLSDRDSFLGVSLGAASAGAAVSVVTSGEIAEPSWSWTPGAPIYIGATGALTQTYPTGMAWARIIAFAQTATSIMIAPRDPIVTA